MSKKKDTLVLFDNDGVLVDSEILACSLRVQQLQSLGIHLSLNEFVMKFAGLPVHEGQSLIEKTYGIKLPADYQSSHKEKLYLAFRHQLKPVAGIELVLNDIKHKAVASNGSKEKISYSLQATGLDCFFSSECIFSAEAVKAPKPDPALFLHVCQILGFSPSNAIVVEDSLSGLQAAADAGIPTIGFAAGSHFIEPEQKERLRSKATLFYCETADALRKTLKGYGA